MSLTCRDCHAKLENGDCPFCDRLDAILDGAPNASNIKEFWHNAEQ